MKIIGITGGVGAGKSQILDFIRDNSKCRILYADAAAKELEKKGNACYQPIVELLGIDILDSDGEIIPAEMAQKIFSDKELLEKVNEIIHPAVKTYILDEIDKAERSGKVDFFFVEAALLIEEGYDLILDELWYIYASPEARRQRLIASRGYSDNKVDAIFASQLDEKTFKHYCSVVIDNDGDFENTKKQLLALLA